MTHHKFQPSKTRPKKKTKNIRWNANAVAEKRQIQILAANEVHTQLRLPQRRKNRVERSFCGCLGRDYENGRRRLAVRQLDNPVGEIEVGICGRDRNRQDRLGRGQWVLRMRIYSFGSALLMLLSDMRNKTRINTTTLDEDKQEETKGEEDEDTEDDGDTRGNR